MTRLLSAHLLTYKMELVLSMAICALPNSRACDPQNETEFAALARKMVRFDRMGGVLYNQTWKVAIQQSPDWIFIESFNYWNEASVIEPSLEFGYQYLYATAHFAAQFKKQGAHFEAIPVLLAIHNATENIEKDYGEDRGIASAN